MSALTYHDRGISSVNPNACNFECRYADSLKRIPPAISECQGGTMNTEEVQFQRENRVSDANR